MNRTLIIIPALMVLFGAQFLFAQAIPPGEEIPVGIRNNRFFIESVRLTILAQQAYDEGNYLASIQFSEEAVRFAHLSDEFVALQLKIRETDNAIAAARRELNFAASVDAATRYPYEYNTAQTAFAEARAYRAAEDWDDAIAAANRVLAALVNITGLEPVIIAQPDPEPEIEPEPIAAEPGQIFLPAQYTVRPWAIYRDSLWDIAGRAWAFNDPWQWRRLYEANRARMPQPGNPDLITPGMILDIPSIRGETRQGMWQPGVEYPPLP